MSEGKGEGRWVGKGVKAGRVNANRGEMMYEGTFPDASGP